jgi:predicted CopG family antitoxin
MLKYEIITEDGNYTIEQVKGDRYQLIKNLKRGQKQLSELLEKDVIKLIKKKRLNFEGNMCYPHYGYDDVYKSCRNAKSCFETLVDSQIKNFDWFKNYIIYKTK